MRKLILPQNVPASACSDSAEFTRAVASNKVLVDNYNPAGTADKPILIFPGYKAILRQKAISLVANGCCGYCGQRVEGVQTPVIEHYRPKAALYFQVNPFNPFNISEKIKITGVSAKCLFGYYQLGDDVKNMIPSCSGCNSGQGTSGIYITKVIGNEVQKGFLEKNISFGKDNFFPLFGLRRKSGLINDPRFSLKSVDAVSTEEPLLFNPYIDDPGELFHYKETDISDVTDYAFIQIRPNPNGSKYQRLKAQASISILGLNRKELCHKRAIKEQNLSNLEKEVNVSREQNDWSLSKWGGFARSYANEFNFEHADLFGFGMHVKASLGQSIKSSILKEITCIENRVFSNTLDFLEIVNELSAFSKAVRRNYGNNQYVDGSNRMMDLVNAEDT